MLDSFSPLQERQVGVWSHFAAIVTWPVDYCQDGFRAIRPDRHALTVFAPVLCLVRQVVPDEDAYTQECFARSSVGCREIFDSRAQFLRAQFPVPYATRQAAFIE